MIWWFAKGVSRARNGCTDINDTSYEVFLREELPFGVAMMAPALRCLVELNFLIVINSLTC